MLASGKVEGPEELVGNNYQKNTNRAKQSEMNSSNRRRAEEAGATSPMETDSRSELVVTLDTKVACLYKSYRVVFAVDYSPSMRRVDAYSGKPFYALLRKKVSRFVRELILPITVWRKGRANPSTIVPEISLSIVLAGGDCSNKHAGGTLRSSFSYGGGAGGGGSASGGSNRLLRSRQEQKYQYNRLMDNPTIIQDFSLTPENVDEFIQELNERLKAAECVDLEDVSREQTTGILQHMNVYRGGLFARSDGSVGSSSSTTQRGGMPSRSSSSSRRGSSRARSGRSAHSAAAASSVLADTLNASLDTIERLHPDCCPVIILFTDGVIELPMAHEYDSLLMTMSRKDIPCHIVRVGTNDAPHSSWGCVSDPGSLLYISHATGGVFFEDRKAMMMTMLSDTNRLRGRGNGGGGRGDGDAPGRSASMDARGSRWGPDLHKYDTDDEFEENHQNWSSSSGANAATNGKVDRGWRQRAILFRYSCLGDGPHRNRGIAKAPSKNANHAAGHGSSANGRPNVQSERKDMSDRKKVNNDLLRRRSPSIVDSQERLPAASSATSGNVINGVIVPSTDADALASHWYQQYPLVDDLNLVRSMQAIDYPFPWYGPPPPAPRCKETVKQYSLIVNLERLLECRSWEGFSATTISYGSDGIQTHISVHGDSSDGRSPSDIISGRLGMYSNMSGVAMELVLTMPWKPGIDIIYNVLADDFTRSTTRVNMSNNRRALSNPTTQTKVRVELVAGVEFLRNFSRAESKADPSSRRKPSRLHRFLSTLHEVDKVLVHLSSPPSMKDVNDLNEKSSSSSLRQSSGSSMMREPGARSAHRAARSSKNDSLSQRSRNNSGSAFFGILGKLPLAMWGRWFCVEQVLAFVVGTTVFPKRQAKNLANILARWSTQRLGRDVHMKILEEEDDEDDENSDGDEDDDNGNDHTVINFGVRKLNLGGKDGGSSRGASPTTSNKGKKKKRSDSESSDSGNDQKRGSKSNAVAFCLTKCKWKDPPNGVVVHIAFHAAKPSTRMTIRDHLASYMSEGGFLIVSPYEQNVAESVYRTLMNKANGLNKYKRVVTPEICERALRACIDAPYEIGMEIVDMGPDQKLDTETLFRSKVLSKWFSPMGTLENTFFFNSYQASQTLNNNSIADESVDGSLSDADATSSISSGGSGANRVIVENRGVPFFLRVKYHASRIRLKCCTRPFDQQEAKPLIELVIKTMREELNASVAEEILANMLRINPITPVVIKKVSEHLDRLPKSRVATRNHPMTLGRDSVFVKAMASHSEWSMVEPHTYKRNHVDYWAMLSIVDDDHCTIRVYGCPEKERKKVIESIIEDVDAASKRAEQAMALAELFDNRMCSNFQLLAANGDPGPLACNAMFEVLLPLHERVQINVALRALAAIPVLHPFSIGNRPHSYVLSKSHYARITKHTQETKGAETAVPGSSSVAPPGKGEAATVDSPSSTPVAAVRVKALKMEVYGITEPGKEITHDLVELIRNKLQSVALSILLRNNPRSLSDADFDIIQPPGQPPVQHFDIRLPTHLKNAERFSKIFSHNARRLLVPLEVSKRRENQRGGDIFNAMVGEKTVANNAFLANGGSVTSSSLAIGRGLAVVYFDIFQPGGVAKQRPPPMEAASAKEGASAAGNEEDGEEVGEPLASNIGDWALPPWHEGHRFLLRLQIWSAGSLNMEKFVNLLEQFVDQSVYTYALEDDFLLRRNGPSGPGLAILDKALLAGTPELYQVEAKRIVPSWATKTVVEGLVSALEGEVVSSETSGTTTKTTTIVRQREGQMLEALATVSSRGVCVWMYRWQVDRRTTSNKNMKQVIDNLMMNVKANKRVVDRCLMAKMGLMESPITSPTVMLSKQLQDEEYKLEPITLLHESILVREAKRKVEKQRLERATLAVRQTCISERRRVGNLPDLGQVLNASRVVKVMRTPLTLTTDATAAAKLYAKVLVTKLGLRRLRNKGKGQVLYGNLPDLILFVVRGRENVLGVDVLVLPGSAAPGPACSRVISLLALEAYAYDTTLKRVHGIQSGLSIRGAKEICEGLDSLLLRYPTGPPSGARNRVERHYIEIGGALLDFVSLHADKYGSRGHRNDGTNAIDFVLSSEEEENISGIVRSVDKSGKSDGVYLYVLVRNLVDQWEGTSDMYNVVVDRCLEWLARVFKVAEADRKRDSLWRKAIVGEEIGHQGNKTLHEGAVEVCKIDPNLKELLSMTTNIRRKEAGGQIRNNFVSTGITGNALIHTNAEGKAFLWRRAGVCLGNIRKEERQLIEAWVVHESCPLFFA